MSALRLEHYFDPKKQTDVKKQRQTRMPPPSLDCLHGFNADL